MSTEFFCDQLDEPVFDVRFARWCTSAARGEEVGRRDLLEFGTVTNFEEVCQMMDMGFTFSPVGMSDDRTDSRASLEAAMARGEVTFGEFPMTIRLGSGEHFRFTEER